MRSRLISSLPRLRCALALCIAIVVAPPSQASAGPDAPSFAQAVRLAVDRAPRLEASRARVEASSEDAKRQGALPDPMLTVGIDNLPVTGPDAFDPNAEDMTMKKIGLRQDFPARAKRDAQRLLAQRRTAEAVAEEQAESLGVKQATADAWIELWGAQRDVEALHAMRQQAVVAAQLAKARVSGGSGSASDALAAQAAVAELDGEVEMAGARAAAAGVRLSRWLGTEVSGVAADAPDFFSLPQSEAALLASVDRSGALLPAAAKVETAAAEVDAARAERRPDWSVMATYGQRSDDRSDMLMVEVGVGLPLFTRNRQDRGVAAREADYRAVVALREDLRLEQSARIRARVAEWEGLKRQVELHADSLQPISHDRSALALAAYRAGGPLQAWLDARRDELASHRSYAEHRLELARAWAALAFIAPESTR